MLPAGKLHRGQIVLNTAMYARITGLSAECPQRASSRARMSYGSDHDLTRNFLGVFTQACFPKELHAPAEDSNVAIEG